jgi:hypothetical protein
MFFSVWQILRRSSKGTRRRKSGNTSRIRVGRYPRHPPGGRVSRRQREWDRAYSHKQNQVKCASNEMRFDRGINLFFHVGSLVKRSSSRFGCRLLVLYKKTARNVNTMFCKFLGFFGAFEPSESVLRRGCSATIWTDDVDCCGRRPPLRSPKRREQEL